MELKKTSVITLKLNSKNSLNQSLIVMEMRKLKITTSRVLSKLLSTLVVQI